MDVTDFGNGELRIRPLAFESLGIRGMATYLETDEVKMVIDPGSALGPRFRLDPHEEEYSALYRSRKRILSAAEEADMLSISHYHFDHFLPNFEDWEFIWSSPEMAEQLYSDKIILAKDISENINTSQRKRGYMFRKNNLDFAEEIRVSDGRSFEIGSTKIRFSKPVYHGPEGTRLGFTLIASISTPNFSFVHAPDVQGPMYKKSLRFILSRDPDLLVVGGPPTYISFKLEEKDLRNSLENLKALVKRIPKVAVDHHLLRSTEYEEFLKPVFEEAENSNHDLIVASQLIGRNPVLLEGRRKELHRKKPLDEEWYDELEEKGIGKKFGE